jgi:hypothetical protein
MGLMLRLRRFFEGRPIVARQPIIVDFDKGQAYRAEESQPSLLRDLFAALRGRAVRPKIVTTVEGLPPHVLGLQKK